MSGRNSERDPLDWFGVAIPDARAVWTRRKPPPSLRGGGADEAIQGRIAALDCFASLAMTGLGKTNALVALDSRLGFQSAGNDKWRSELFKRKR